MSITPRKDFNSADFDDSSDIKGRENFTTDSQWQLVAETQPDQAGESRSYPQRVAGFGWRIRLLVVLIVCLLCWPVVSAVVTWWQQPGWLNGVWAALLVMVSLMIGGWLLRQWLSLRALQRRQRDAQTALEVAQLSGPAMRRVCEQIAQRSAITDVALKNWQGLIEPHHNAEEVLQLFERELLLPIDKATKTLIAKWSSEAAAMVALSPYASLDMLLVLWRNSRMLNHIAQQYGLLPGFVAQFYLMRLVLENIAFAGVTEVVTDIGLESLGAELTSRLSTRAAQGMSAGLLSARVGYKCLQLCRPIPLRADQTPKLAGIVQQLAQEVEALNAK